MMKILRKTLFVLMLTAGLAVVASAQRDPKRPTPPKEDPPVVNPQPKNPPKNTPTPEPRRPPRRSETAANIPGQDDQEFA